MQLRKEYTLIKPRALTLTKFEVPAEFELDGNRNVKIIEFNEQSWHLSVTGPVDVNSLSLVADSGWFRESGDGTRQPVPAVEVEDPALDETAVLARSIASGLTFLLDAPVGFSVRPDADELIPETETDAELLVQWGTRRPMFRVYASVGGGSVSGRVDANDLLRVLPQQAGLRLYEEALLADTSTARFRDLWRVLESAFTRSDDDLLDLLARYEPTARQGLDRDDLTALLVIRGRASHAQSKAGLKEVAAVEALCRENLPQLKDLVERVLETKKDWGYPTLGSEARLAPRRRISVTQRAV